MRQKDGVMLTFKIDRDKMMMYCYAVLNTKHKSEN